MKRRTTAVSPLNPDDNAAVLAISLPFSNLKNKNKINLKNSNNNQEFRRRERERGAARNWNFAGRGERERGGGSVRWVDRANTVGGPQQTQCQYVIGFDDQREKFLLATNDETGVVVLRNRVSLTSNALKPAPTVTFFFFFVTERQL